MTRSVFGIWSIFLTAFSSNQPNMQVPRPSSVACKQKCSAAIPISIKLNFFKNELKLGYKSVGRSFKSLGSPGVQTDIKGFSVSDRLRLFNNRIYLNFGFDNYDDNVNDRAETTTNKKTMTGGMSFYTPPSLPNLNFSTRLYNRKNDAEIVYVYLPDGSLDSTGNPVEDQTPQ